MRILELITTDDPPKAPVITPTGVYTWQRFEPCTRKDGTATTLLIWRFVCAHCGSGREVKATRGGITDRFRCDCRKVHPWRR